MALTGLNLIYGKNTLMVLFGPDGFAETWGHPKKVRSSARSHDREVATRLWEVSEELTGVRFEGLAG